MPASCLHPSPPISSCHCALLGTQETLKGRFSFGLLLVCSCTPFSSLWTVKRETWKVNCYFYALENEAQAGSKSWGNSNRQKLSKRMHQSLSCFKFFQTLARCPYPYITVCIEAPFCTLGIKSLADILCVMQRFNIHAAIPPRNRSECCPLQGSHPFTFHYFVLSLRITSGKWWGIFQMCIFICLSPVVCRENSYWKEWEEKTSASMFRRGIGLFSIGSGVRMKQSRAILNRSQSLLALLLFCNHHHHLQWDL